MREYYQVSKEFLSYSPIYLNIYNFPNNFGRLAKPANVAIFI